MDAVQKQQLEEILWKAMVPDVKSYSVSLGTSYKEFCLETPNHKLILCCLH